MSDGASRRRDRRRQSSTEMRQVYNCGAMKSGGQEGGTAGRGTGRWDLALREVSWYRVCHKQGARRGRDSRHGPNGLRLPLPSLTTRLGGLQHGPDGPEGEEYAVEGHRRRVVEHLPRLPPHATPLTRPARPARRCRHACGARDARPSPRSTPPLHRWSKPGRPCQALSRCTLSLPSLRTMARNAPPVPLTGTCCAAPLRAAEPSTRAAPAHRGQRRGRHAP